MMAASIILKCISCGETRDIIKQPLKPHESIPLCQKDGKPMIFVKVSVVRD